jgi:manganese/zinc/iron transport system permease protein
MGQRLSAQFAQLEASWWGIDQLVERLLGPGGGMHAWAIATAALVAVACGLVGTLLVVRRMSLVGDAISHAVLPGIVVAVLAGGRPGGPLVLAAAVATALATVWLTERLTVAGRLAEDASAGVVFTTLFAGGVLLVTVAASRIDLDPGCILHGVLELVPFDTVAVAGREVPRGFLTAVAVCAGLTLAAFCTWKLQVFAAFDPEAAAAAGIPVRGVTAGLMAATALATVASFEVVGAILVVALLVVPAATAELLTHRLHRMALLAAMLGGCAAVLGYLAAWRFDTSAAGMIAVVLGLQYAAAVFFAPEDGLVTRGGRRLALAWRVACEDRLAARWRAVEGRDRGTSEKSVAPATSTTPAMAAAPAEPLAAGLIDLRPVDLWLAATGRITRGPAGWILTARGREQAEMVVRSHRLWESWLGRHAELPADHLHPPAEWIEHHLGAEARRRIAAEVGSWASDPHGRPIPPEP